MNNSSPKYENLVPDTGVGEPRRLEYISLELERIIEARGAEEVVVVDIGAGTGTYLTIPLAKLFPTVRIIAFEPHEPSSDFLREICADQGIENISCVAEFPSGSKADLVLLSEVIEHVYEPKALLERCKSLLRENSSAALVVTCPNGYGLGEFISFIYLLVHKMFGVRKKHFLKEDLVDRAFLAANGHVNFFRRRQVVSLIGAIGLTVSDMSARAFICGYGVNSLLRSTNLTKANRKLASVLPMRFSSCWMFTASLSDGEMAEEYNYRLGAFSRLRRHLNEVRYNEHYQ